MLGLRHSNDACLPATLFAHFMFDIKPPDNVEKQYLSELGN